MRSHWLKTTTLASGRSSISSSSVDRLVGLGAVVGAVIEQVGAVAGHAHVLQGDHQPALVGLGQEAIAPPLLHDAGDDLLVLRRDARVCWSRHRHEEVLVDPLGQLLEHLVLVPADQDRRQRLADAGRGRGSRRPCRPRRAPGARAASGRSAPGGSDRRTARWRSALPAGSPAACRSGRWRRARRSS